MKQSFLAGWRLGSVAGVLGFHLFSMTTPANAAFDAAAAFSTNSNPNGVWSYGYNTNLGGAMTLYTESGNWAGLDYWRTDVGLGVPAVYHNPAGSPANNTGTVVLGPGSNGEFCIIRFTAPSNGQYQVSGTFSGADTHGTTTDVHVLVNGVIFNGVVNGYGAGSGPTFNIIAALNVGDAIAFAVGRGSNSNFFFDSTALSVQISGLPGAPPPTIPVITSQPQSQTVFAGADATFEVTASGTAPLSYQWSFNGTNLSGATDSALALNQVTVSAAGFYSVRVTNAAGSVVSSSAALTVVSYISNALINVNFGGHLTPEGLSSNKVGLAAIGRTTNDLWNFYSRDIAPGQFRQNGALVNLQRADGSGTTAGLVVNNAPGAWFTSSTDVMYHGFLYPNSGNVTLTVTNLPAGQYEVYLYSGQGNCHLSVGGADYGTRTTHDELYANPTVWLEGVQYARFANVQVAAGQAVMIVVSVGAGGTAAIAGLQIAGVTTNAPSATIPTITSQPQSQTVFTDEDATFAATASGTAPLSYQWSFNGTNLSGATGSALALNQVTVSAAGFYSVRVTNAAGSVVSSNAALTVVGYVSNTLINVNFGGHLTPEGLSSNKVGLAAIGRTTNDLWNFYSRDIAPGQYRQNGALTNLQQADASATTAGLVVNNAAGAWFNSSTDVMYHGYLYPLSPSDGTATLTLTNLAAGNYEVYLYSGQANFHLLVGGVDYGTRTTHENPVVNPVVWQEGMQYARFTDVQVAAGQAVTIVVLPGAAGEAAFAGLQIAHAVPPSTPALTASRLASLIFNPDSSVRVCFAGVAVNNYTVQASTNLVDWEPIGVATNCGLDQFEFKDSQTEFPRRFYRIVCP